MARAPNEETKKLQAQAESLYRGGMKLVDIAKKIGRPLSVDGKRNADGKIRQVQRIKKKKANVR